MQRNKTQHLYLFDSSYTVIRQNSGNEENTTRQKKKNPVIWCRQQLQLRQLQDASARPDLLLVVVPLLISLFVHPQILLSPPLRIHTGEFGKRHEDRGVQVFIKMLRASFFPFCQCQQGVKCGAA